MVGVIKGSHQKHLKTGVGKAKVIHKGEGVLKVSLPLPPPRKILIIYYGCLF